MNEITDLSELCKKSLCLSDPEEDITPSLVDIPNDFLNILIIDVGVHHLGMVLARINKDYTGPQIIDINLINITKYTHNNVSSDKCTLYHEKTFHDWMTHVFIEHTAFDEADIILVERQPPLGFVVIEQIIFGKYRHKTHLIHPRNVHSFMNITHLDYDGRKEKSEILGKKYLSSEQLQEIMTFERSHDITDGICMLLYWLNKKNKEHRDLLSRQYLQTQRNSLEYRETSDYFEQFRYKF